ncbi:MAG TPA: hypothetical protein VF121_05680 [Thermoanaerobaculia bacterium]|nr:hypothetical protein [Thermoanaerobaculia bacterium]
MPGGLLSGAVRIIADVEGLTGAPPERQVERVAFRLDGRPLVTHARAPFDVRLDLGPVPLEPRLTAEALARDGSVEARDERVELFLDETPVATVFQPPFAQPIALPRAGAVAYVRAVAYLAGGGVAEDLVMLNRRVLESARRAGIAIYAVGLDLRPGEAAAAQETLTRLAAETGGRSFFVAWTEALPAVYREIERELRAQYRLSYQPGNSSVEDRFRLVQVEVAGGGVEARTINGYHP